MAIDGDFIPAPKKKNRDSSSSSEAVSAVKDKDTNNKSTANVLEVKSAPPKEEPVNKVEPKVAPSAEEVQSTIARGEETQPAPAWHGFLYYTWWLVKFAVTTLVLVTSISFGTILGITIYRTYFAIPEEVEVPAIQGKNFLEANEILKKAGLRLRIEEGKHTGKFPNRVIISQEPAPGKSVRKEREILAVVSLGPERYKVPVLKGHNLREVKKMLNNNKLILGKVTYVQKDSNRPEEVIDQKPVAGSFVTKGDKVDITINKGFGMAKVVVPDCRERPLAKALPLLEKVNLNVGKVTWSVSENNVAGRVLSQSPPSGSDVMSDTDVELEVSLGSSGKHIIRKRKMEIFLPAGSEPQDLQVILSNDQGQEEIYRASHVMGDSVKLWVTGLPNSTIEVYVNSKLFMRDNL
ncbi:PASTA domain-containing protein [bacterium]|nr:PASTA domain-containing protein [bacterium]